MKNTTLPAVSARIPDLSVDPATSYTNELSPKTKLSYASDIKQFFGVKRLQDITVDMIQTVDVEIGNTWAQDLLRAGLKKSTINKKMTSLHGFYQFACRRSVGLMDYNPFDTNEGSIRYKNTISRFATSEALMPYQVRQLIDSIDTSSHNKYKNMVNCRNKLIIEILATTGMRREELVRLKVEDYQRMKGKHVFRILGKGNKERYTVIPQQVILDMKKYFKYRGIKLEPKYNDYYIVTNVNKGGSKTDQLSTTSINLIVTKVAKEAGFRKGQVTPHILRHTFCTESLRSGAKLEDVQDLMGHASIATTRRYDHINRVIDNATGETLAEEFGITK